MKEHLELRYLQRLAELYPTIAKASTEIINLQSILNLPKGTEHFITDIHGTIFPRAEKWFRFCEKEDRRRVRPHAERRR